MTDNELLTQLLTVAYDIKNLLKFVVLGLGMVLGFAAWTWSNYAFGYLRCLLPEAPVER